MHFGCVQCLVVGQVQEMFALVLLLCDHNLILPFGVGTFCVSVVTLDTILTLLCGTTNYFILHVTKQFYSCGEFNQLEDKIRILCDLKETSFTDCV